MNRNMWLCLVAIFMFLALSVVLADYLYFNPKDQRLSPYAADEVLGWAPKKDFGRNFPQKDAAGNRYDAFFSLDHNRFRAYGDTATCLDVFSSDPDIRIINKTNSGHGPTILVGYSLAVDEADWVFQVDSDDEMSPVFFEELWDKRAGYSALFGIRTGRSQNWGRKIISAVSRATVRHLYGKGVTDVNVPFRLIKAPLLKRIIDQIPNDTFAPNIIISGALAAATVPIYNHPVPHQVRKTGVISIVRWKLWKASVRSFLQTVRCRPHL